MTIAVGRGLDEIGLWKGVTGMVGKRTSARIAALLVSVAVFGRRWRPPKSRQ
jgi:hypothetical protein